MPARVLVISNMYPSPQDAAYGQFVARCVDGLRGAGINVDTVVLRRRSAGAWATLAAYLQFIWHANRSVLAGGHDCIWLHQPLHSLLAVLPALWLQPAPLVLNFHGHDLLPVTRRGRLLRRLLRRRFGGAQRVVVPSAHFKRLFDQEFPGRGALVFPSGGVAPSYLSPAPPWMQRPRSVLFLSRWVRGKGWPAYLQMAEQLARADAGLCFTVAGGGPDGAHIAQAVERLGLDGRVTLVASQDVASNAALFRRHRYAVLPSDFDESLALVNLEAMASGCIVLSRDFAAAREYIHHGHNGFRFAALGFADACTATLLRLEAEPQRGQRIADAARASAAAYDEPRVMAALPQLLGLTR